MMDDKYFNRKQQIIILIVVNSLVVLAFLLFPLYMKFSDSLGASQCGVIKMFYLYCPACGCTRAFAALRNFDIISSIKYNPIVVMCMVLLVVYDIVSLKYIIKREDRGVLMKPWMVAVFFTLWGIYFVVRNVLLFTGIDMLGNVYELLGH